MLAIRVYGNRSKDETNFTRVETPARLRRFPYRIERMGISVSTKTRAEHLAWCKQRAWQEFDYYMKEEGFEAAARNAKVSMMSDLGKHPETAGSQEAAMMLMMLPMKSREDVKKFMEGFN